MSKSVAKFKRHKSARAARLVEIIRDQGFVPFTGELMQCVLCLVEQRSDPSVSRGWRCWVMDGSDRFYVCAGCQPPRGSSISAWSALYLRACQAFMATRENFTPARRVVVWIERGGDGHVLN